MTKMLKGMVLALGLAIIPMLLGLVVIVLTIWTWTETNYGVEKLIVGGLALLLLAFVLLVQFVWLTAHLVYTIIVLVRAVSESSVGGIIAALFTLVYNVVAFVCAILFFAIFDYGIEISLLLLVLGVAMLIMNIIVSLSSVESQVLMNEKTMTF